MTANRRPPRLQFCSAVITPSFLARSIRLLTEEGPQRVPPRGVRSNMASRAFSRLMESIGVFRDVEL